jgi:hypothetical protein
MDVWNNKDCSFLRLKCFEHKKIFWFASKFEHVNFAINGKCFKNICDNPNYYDSFTNFPNIQNNNFKECPFTWVTPLVLFLPYATSSKLCTSLITTHLRKNNVEEVCF